MSLPQRPARLVPISLAASDSDDSPKIVDVGLAAVLDPVADAASDHLEAASSGGDTESASKRPGPPSRPEVKLPDGPLPIRMLHDRVLVMLDAESAERRSSGGILIPATASVGKRLAWAYVVAAGVHVRQVKVRDRVLFDPEDRAEVELGGQDYILLRERDIHGVAEPEPHGDDTGLYL